MFFFNDTATTEIYTLSLHDALPICRHRVVLLQERRQRHHPGVVHHHVERPQPVFDLVQERHEALPVGDVEDRKSTRLNSSHANISYAVFCLKKKNNHHTIMMSVRRW